jgi:2',3'-cyclic-nucleotide 2'-phosphodiesterase (5'-nucleotidase family)
MLRLRLLLLAFAFLWATVSCRYHYRITADKKSLYSVVTHDTLSADSLALALLLPYKSQLDSTMNQRLCSSDMIMQKARPEGLLGNFVADLCLEEVQQVIADKSFTIDFCFLNNGGLRSIIPKGDITLRHIYEVMPFDNELVILILDGSTTRQLIQSIMEKGGEPVSGLRLSLNAVSRPHVWIRNLPLDESRDYAVLTSNYLANGGDQYGFLKNRKAYLPTGLLVRDAIINHCKKADLAGRKITAVLDNRIYYE